MTPYAGDLSNGPWSYYNGNTGVTSNFTTGIVRRGYYSKTSIKTPGFHTLTKAQKKSLPWHPFTEISRVGVTKPWTMVAYTVGVGGGKVMFVRKGHIAGANLGAGNGTLGDPSFSGLALALAESERRALANCQKQVANFKVGLAQAMAERKQTAGLMAQSMKRLVSFALLLRRGKFDELYKKYGIPKPVQTKSGAWVVPRYRKISRTYSVAFDERGNPLARPRKVRTAAYREVHTRRTLQFDNLWLEFQYGWKPLLNDIYDSCQAIANVHYKQRHLRFTGSGSYEVSAVRPGPTYSEGGGAQFPTLFKTTVKAKTRYVLECSEENTLLTTLANTGITNPAALAWELLPYSFVLDWFVPVGDYLEQLEYTRGMTFARACKTSRFVADGLLSHIGRSVSIPDESYPYLGEIAGSPISTRMDWKNRVILGSFPYRKFPTFSPNLGIEKALSGLALLSQLMKGDVSHRKVMRYM